MAERYDDTQYWVQYKVATIFRMTIVWIDICKNIICYLIIHHLTYFCFVLF